jgi:hypothetical protein
MGLKVDDEKKAFEEGGIINILPQKDHKGRRTLILHYGKVWNPDLVQNDQIFRLLYISKWQKIYIKEKFQSKNGSFLQCTSSLSLRSQLKLMESLSSLISKDFQ